MAKVVVMVQIVMASGDNGDGEGGGVVVACDGDGDYGDSEVVFRSGARGSGMVVVGGGRGWT